LRELLGGPVVESIEIYNTCAGNDYVRSNAQQSSNNWGLPIADKADRYDDLWRFLHEPARLARDLADEGYRGMKVWPFDLAAEASGGDHRADLKFGLGVLDSIRDEVGDSMDLYVELHSLWQPRGAERILRALEPYGLAWAEDPIRADRYEALASLREGTSVPIALGENVGAGYNSYKPSDGAAELRLQCARRPSPTNTEFRWPLMIAPARFLSRSRRIWSPPCPTVMFRKSRAAFITDGTGR
jgi:L-alanine-DL-glutamate epimerase-like enolase superfamily enzyme